MNSSTDTSDQDSDAQEEVQIREPNPAEVDFYFLKTGKSKGDGVLVTHGDTFKFTKNNVNRNGTVHYYACAQKLTHKCQARAIIKRVEGIDEDGSEIIQISLVEVATPEVVKNKLFAFLIL